MTTRSITLPVALLSIGLATSVFATPAFAAVNDDAVGLGFDSSRMTFNFLAEDIEFSGFTGFVKIGADPRWGIILAYKIVEDNEDLLPGEKLSYDQVGVYGSRLWRTEKVFRPHIKFGLISVKFAIESPGSPFLGETTTGLAFGGGFELGSPRVAFLLDYEYGLVQLFNEDVDLNDLMLGVVFKY